MELKKFSERSTEEGMDIFCMAIPAINSILSDSQLKANIKRAAEAKADVKTLADRIRFGAERINEFVPLVFRAHRDDICMILAALNGCTVEEVKSQPVALTVAQVLFYAKDEALIQLFTSQEQTGDADSSASALGTTTAP